VRILFITPQMPYPPEKGTALRNWGLIKGLANKHDVAVLSFGDAAQPGLLPAGFTSVCRGELVAPHVRSLRARLLDMVRNPLPDMALRLTSDEFRHHLQAWLNRERFEVVHIEGIEMAQYLDVVAKSACRPLIVFDNHNCEYLLQQRAFEMDIRRPSRWTSAIYSFIQWRRLRKYEAWVCGRADRVMAVSEADAEAVHRIVPGIGIVVIPNGIDSDAYQPHSSRDQEEFALVFTGTMDFRPNVDAVLWFGRKILPLVQAMVPDVHLYIVGQRPHRRLHRLAGNPAVTITGWVRDPRPYIARASVYVVPLRVGGGTRLKLLEAMAMGKAVVSTRVGAEGYPVTDGREVMFADSPVDFASVVVRLLGDPQLRASMGKHGRAFVEHGYDWRAIVPRVESIYRR